MFYAFEADPDLCIVDIHEDGAHLYPGTGFADETGSGSAAGTKMNLPLKPGTNDESVLRIWPDAETLIRASEPEFIIFQCGADSIANDPITHLRLTPAAHAHVASRLCTIADEYCNGRLIALGGGGYNRENLARAWCAVLKALLQGC